MSLISAFLILLLPETHNKSLMDTIEHVKQRKVVAETRFDAEDDFEPSTNVEGSSLMRMKNPHTG